MTILGIPATASAERAGSDTKPHAVPHRHEPNAGLLEGELLDIYGAILIAVPLALFLKSLWF